MRAGLLLLVLAAPCSTAFAAAIHTFDLPHGASTCGLAIASDGSIIGDDPDITERPKPFLYAKRVFTFPAAAMRGTVTFLGINTAHTIVGVHEHQGRFDSFVMRGGATRRFRVPGASLTLAAGINDAGTIVGTYQKQAGGTYVGFIRHGQTITTLDSGSGDTEPQAIDQTGTVVVGTSINGTTYTGFIYKDGAFTTLAVPGAMGTFARGIGKDGRVSGTYLTSVNPTVFHGFLYDHGIFRTYDLPGATSTQFGGIDDRGTVTGCATDQTGTHGFFTRP